MIFCYYSGECGLILMCLLILLGGFVANLSVLWWNCSIRGLLGLKFIAISFAIGCCMERGFLSLKGSDGGRGVKVKRGGSFDVSAKDDNGIHEGTNTSSNVATNTQSDVILSGHTVNVDANVETTSLRSYPPLPAMGSTLVATSASNAPGKSSYANVAGKPSGKKLNFRTLFTSGGNGIDVVVLVESIRTISERFANTVYVFFLGKRVAYPVVANYVRNTWGKYELVRSMFSSSTGLFSFQFISMDGLDAMLENGLWFIHNNPLILRKWHPDENLLKEDVTDMCMQSWGRSSYTRVMIELRVDVELKDNIVAAMHKIIGEGYYIPVIFMLSMSANPLGKLRFMDDDGNPLVPTGIVDSDSEVEVDFDETANLRISMSGKEGSDKGYGTNSLLEKWSDSYQDNDDYDPYNDDMYENHDMSEHLQSICDDLDITVSGRKKK
ncbi:hypothetical protein Tco_0737291 [Tanacetum coccineum]